MWGHKTCLGSRRPQPMLLRPWAATLEDAATSYPLPGPQLPSSDNLIGLRVRIPVPPAVGAHVRLIHCHGLPDLPILHSFPGTPIPTTTDTEWGCTCVPRTTPATDAKCPPAVQTAPAMNLTAFPGMIQLPGTANHGLGTAPKVLRALPGLVVIFRHPHPREGAPGQREAQSSALLLMPARAIRPQPGRGRCEQKGRSQVGQAQPFTW